MQIVTLYKTEYGLFKDKQKAIDHYNNRHNHYWGVLTEKEIPIKEVKALYCDGEFFKLKQLVIEDE